MSRTWRHTVFAALQVCLLLSCMLTVAPMAAVASNAAEPATMAVCDTIPLYVDSVFSEPYVILDVDGKPMRMIVDTGSNESGIFIDTNDTISFADSVSSGMDANGSAFTFKRNSVKMTFGRYSTMTDVVLVSPDSLIASHFDGILGFSFVCQLGYAMKMDVRNRQLIVFSSSNIHKEHGIRVPFRLDSNGQPRLKVRIDEKIKLKDVLLDTGFNGLISISRPWYDKATRNGKGKRLLADVVDEGYGTGFGSIGGAPDSVKITLLHLKSIRLGDYVFPTDKVYVSTDEHGLGNAILRHGAITIRMKPGRRKGIVLFQPY